MAWSKLDDNFYDHPKVISVWKRNPGAVGLHCRALTYCARHLTDGVLSVAAVEALSPDQRDRVGQIEALVEERAWYWDEARSVYVIHDFLDYHPTKGEREAERKKERERKRKERAE
jgi:hypothetical protein